ncbi:DUF2243 domain-containing protein [Shouchella shacheensis]|uniref:DUF2243 domain-containing protein n=1 Tax=Shouchella shacheensis TaxID=1649580 RepID=UPI00073FC8A5|nr:DUF2243 domain-containing protein [Shouchella shacheensis]
MTTVTDNQKNNTRSMYASRNLWSGLLFGVGIAAFIDEAVFHLILHWHHFYDKATTEIGLISDGLFHALGWFATIGGLFVFADLRRRKALWPVRWWGSVLMGTGAFQLYDGTIQHKLMRLHQIRYDVENLLIYDLVWSMVAVLLIVAGLILVIRTRSKAHQVKKEAPNGS